MATTATEIQALYVAYFNRPADVLGLQFWLDRANEPGKSADTVANEFSNSKEYRDLYANKTSAEIVDAIYMNLFGRHAEAEGLIYWANKLNKGELNIGNVARIISTSAQNEDLVAIDSKVAASTQFTESLTDAAEILGYSGDAANAVAKTWLAGVKDETTLAAATTPAALDAVSAAAVEAHAGTVNNPLNLTLTTGVDAIVGGAGNDTINGSNSGATSTFTGLDSIDGGAGKDSLVISDVVGDINLSLASVKNVETALVTSTGGLSGEAADVSGWTGLTAATFALKDAAAVQTITAAGTTAVTVSNTAGVTVVGGSSANVTVGSGVAAALATLRAAITVASTDANITTALDAALAAGAITAGQRTTIETAYGFGGGAANPTAGEVTAGQGAIDTVIAAAAPLAAITITSNSTLASATTKGGSTVTIADGSTSANQLKAVSLDGNTGAASLTGKALTTVTVANGVAASDVTINNTTADHTLTLNVAGNASGVVVTDAAAKVVNVATTTAKSNVAVAAANATTINASGDFLLTLDATGADYTKLAALNISGKGGVSANVAAAAALTAIDASTSTGANSITLDATKTTYAGGSGVDTVTVAATPTKAINGGAGTADELVINVAAGTFSNPSSVALITGFETLGLGASASGTYDATGFTNLHSATGNAVAFSNVAANAGLLIDVAAAGGITYTLKDATGTADVLNLTVKSAAALAAGSVTAAGVETVNLTVTDSNTTAHVDTLTLVAADAKSIVVTGNAGVTLTNAASVLVTNFDASAVTGTGSAVTYTSANNKATDAVSIKGGAGNDVLTGSVAVDTIVGGAGDDTIGGSTGLDILTGGAGADTFKFAMNANGNIYSTVTDFTKGAPTVGDKLDLSGLDVSAIANTAALGAQVTLGATAAFADFLAAAASGHATAGTTAAVVTWFQFGGDTYVVVDNTDADVFTNGAGAGDQVVKLTGLVDLAKADITSSVLTLA